MNNQQQIQVGHYRSTFTAVSIGQVIEWYDFFIYGTASAFIFRELFFPTTSPLAGTLLSFATFGVAFLARPLGGVIFGHVGDKFGRKPALFITFIVMGAASGFVGLLPTYNSIGVWAPIILTILRLLQGISVGGEYGGAVLMSVEHAPRDRRSFFGSFVQIGSPIGLILSNGVFLVMAVPNPDAFSLWAWRLPFLVSFALVIVGVFVRWRLEESPEFAQLVEASDGARTQHLPLMTVLREQKMPMLLTAGTYLSCGAITYTAVVYSIGYGTKVVGYSFGEVLAMIIISQALGIVLVPLAGKWGDRVGMRTLVVWGTVGCAVLLFPWLALFNTGSFGLALLGFSLLAVPYYINYGVLSTFFAVAFKTKVGYSGFSLAYQVGTIISSGIAPTIATLLVAWTGTVYSVGWYLLAMCVISTLSAIWLGRSGGKHSDADQVAVPAVP